MKCLCGINCTNKILSGFTNWYKCECGIYISNNNRYPCYKYFGDFIVYFTMKYGGGISIYSKSSNILVVSVIKMNKINMLNLTNDKVLSIIKFANILK